MTAEISILNKTAIVLAGDSAVTIGDGKKIYNTANKIFQLTECGTVGIMIYNQSNWMGIPLETIIKTYSKENGAKTYKTLEEYAISFFNFLESNIFKHISESFQDEIINDKTHEHLNALNYLGEESIEEKLNQKIISSEDFKVKYEELLSIEMQNILIDLDQGIEKFSKVMKYFTEYTFDTFKQKYSKEINDILNGFSTHTSIKLSKKFKDLFIKFIYKDIISGISEDEIYTGIVIAGFGEDEIFPKIQDFKLAELFENRLRFEEGTMTEIDNETIAIIRPFAQRDMVDTFMQGVEPNLLKNIEEIISFELENLINTISTKHKIAKSTLTAIFDKSQENIEKKIFEYRDSRHIDPTITTVSYLNKEGLIELADSLVSITSLKRKTSSDLETVGGPVDIAIITKGEGFKWVKTKEINNI